MKKIGIVNVALRCTPKDAERLVACLAERYVTYWVHADMAQAVFMREALTTDHVRLWVDLMGFTVAEDLQLSVLASPAVTAFICAQADMPRLAPRIRSVLEGKKCIVSDTPGVVNYANHFRHINTGEPAFVSTDQRTVQGVVVLPEHLYMILVFGAWREKEVVVVPDHFSGSYKPDLEICARASLMATYLKMGATRVTLPAEYLLKQTDPLKTYDDLHELIAKERQVKPA